MQFQGAMAVHGNFGTGRARHSVRAVVANQHAWSGNGGGQRTARPTRRCPTVKLYCHIAACVRPLIAWIHEA